MAVKQRKRRWSDEEKRSICFEAMVAGVSVSQVARRYAMNANLIFKWLRDERYTPELDATAEEAEPVFLPVEIEAAISQVPALTPVPSGRIEIEFPDGCRVSAEGGFDVKVLARLLDALSDGLGGRPKLI